jgi:hypothetical protein
MGTEAGRLERNAHAPGDGVHHAPRSAQALVGTMPQNSNEHEREAGLTVPGGVWEGSAVAHAKGPKALAWRDMLWLLVTGAGVLLLVCAALSL